jgi:hypothetical protein
MTLPPPSPASPATTARILHASLAASAAVLRRSRSSEGAFAPGGGAVTFAAYAGRLGLLAGPAFRRLIPERAASRPPTPVAAVSPEGGRRLGHGGTVPSVLGHGRRRTADAATPVLAGFGCSATAPGRLPHNVLVSTALLPFPNYAPTLLRFDTPRRPGPSGFEVAPARLWREAAASPTTSGATCTATLRDSTAPSCVRRPPRRDRPDGGARGRGGVPLPGDRRLGPAVSSASASRC